MKNSNHAKPRHICLPDWLLPTLVCGMLFALCVLVYALPLIISR